MKVHAASKFSPLTISITFDEENELDLFLELLKYAPAVSNVVAHENIDKDKLIVMMAQILSAIKRERS